MGRIASTLSLLVAICSISAAHGTDYNHEEEATDKFVNDEDDYGISPTATIITIVVIILIKVSILLYCCMCCRASPIYRLYHRNSSSNGLIIQAPSSYPVYIGQNNLGMSLPPQPVMLHHPPPQYSTSKPVAPSFFRLV